MKRNVLLLTIDALGADKCWDIAGRLMPFTEAAGSRGVLFKNVISTTSSTTPSIASIHTGLYPKEHGVESTYGFQLNQCVTTLAELLKRNGYRTFASVGGPLFPKTGLLRGFDRYIHRPAHLDLKFLKWRYRINRMKLNRYFLLRETELIVRTPIPWFYWIHILDLHNRWRDRATSTDSSLSDYEKALVSVDALMNAIIDKIDLKNTLVVICADHGHYVSAIDTKRPGLDYSEAHGFHVYDLLVRVPLIILAEGFLPEGVVINEQISTVDIFPSLMDILGFSHPAEVSGQSFASQLFPDKSRTHPHMEQPAYMEACGSILQKAGNAFLMGIRSKGWKLVVAQEPESDRAPELYNLTQDPLELVNVYQQYPERARALLCELNQKRAEQKVLGRTEPADRKC